MRPATWCRWWQSEAGWGEAGLKDKSFSVERLNGISWKCKEKTHLVKKVLAALAVEWGLAAESDGGSYQCWRVQEVWAALQADYPGQCIHGCSIALASLLEKGKAQVCISCLMHFSLVQGQSCGAPWPDPGVPGLVRCCNWCLGWVQLWRTEGDARVWVTETRKESEGFAGSKCKVED